MENVLSQILTTGSSRFRFIVDIQCKTKRGSISLFGGPPYFTGACMCCIECGVMGEVVFGV